MQYKIRRNRLALWIAASVVFALAAPVARAEDAPTRSVFLYMVDVDNTMVGCPKCFFGKRTDDVMPAVIDQIVGEVRAARRPLDVYVVPFARGVADLDAEGPFDPWRRFAIEKDEDVDLLAEYLDPEQYGPPHKKGETVSSRVLPAYGSERTGLQAWKGLREAVSEKEYFQLALYDSIIEGLNFLRNLPPKAADKRREYAATHEHKLVVFSDGSNAVKSASFPHIVQAVGLHREEMDGRFWLTRVYMEGKQPDEVVDGELYDERKIAETADGVYRMKDKALPNPDDMVRPESLDVNVVGGLKDPARYASGELIFPSGLRFAHGVPAGLTVDVVPTVFAEWPEGAALTRADDKAPDDDPALLRMSGITNLMDSGLGRITAKLRLTLAKPSSGTQPIFLDSGAPELFVYLDIDLTPPTGRVHVAVTPPNAGHTTEIGTIAWSIGGMSRREFANDKIQPGTIRFEPDTYVPKGPVMTLEFDELLLDVQQNGQQLTSGQQADLSDLRVRIKAPPVAGEKSASLKLRSTRSHVVFGESDPEWTLRFDYAVKSDLPLYLAGAGAVVLLFVVIALVLRRTLLRPPKIGEVGGTLTMVLAPEADMTDSHDLYKVEKTVFTVGSGPNNDWVIKGDLAPVVAFEIRRLRGEGRLRVRKKDPEVENVLLNGYEMVETYLKDGDVIELLEHRFEYRR